MNHGIAPCLKSMGRTGSASERGILKINIYAYDELISRPVATSAERRIREQIDMCEDSKNAS